MTVSTTTNSVQYTGNGVTTVFSVPFVFYDASDLIVTYTVIATGVDTVKTITTDYTVSGGSGSTGSVTALSAPASTIRITIERSVPYTQETDFLEGAAVLAETVEESFDRSVVLSQQLLDGVDRSLKFPTTLASSYTGLLPAPEDGKILTWAGATGQIGNSDIADLSTTIDTVFTGLADGDFLTYNGTNWVNSGRDELIIDSIQTSGSSGVMFKNSGGTTVATIGPANTTNVAIAGGLTLGTDLQVADGGTGSSTTLAAFNNLNAAYYSNRVLYGLTLSNNVSDATNDIDVAAGACVSDDGTTLIVLSAITKRLDAAWAVGTNQGGLDTGSIANTTYHLWAISKAGGADADVLFSISASAPTMPTDYTKKKCIGSIVRVSAAIKAFTQYGNYFEWVTPVVDVDAQNPGTSAVTRSITVPAGVKVRARVNCGIYSGTTGSVAGYVSSLDQSDTAPQVFNTATLTGQANFHGCDTGTSWNFNPVDVWTNVSTTAQIRTRIGTSGALDRIGIITQGWVDPRI